MNEIGQDEKRVGRTENFEGERVLELVGWQDKFAVGAVSQYGQHRVCVYVIYPPICFRSRFFVLLPHPTSRCCRGCG